MNPNTNDNSKHIVIESLMGNTRKIDVFQTVLFIIGGISCGTLGLTSLNGLVFFLFVSVAVALGIPTKMNFDTMLYANTSLVNLWIQGISSHVLSFVLFWTLSYALVYIY